MERTELEGVEEGAKVGAIAAIAIPTGLDGAIEYVNRLFDSLTESRVKAATRAPGLRTRIEEWYSEDGSIGGSIINRMEEVLSFDRISHWIDYDVLSPPALWGLVPVLHEYPRGEFHLTRAADVLVTAAVECVHRTEMPGGYHVQKNEVYESVDREHECSTALAEAAHLSILALLNSDEIHPHVVYLLVRRMYKRPDSLDFDRSQYFIKQVYDHGILMDDGVEQLEPELPFAQEALVALARWHHGSQHLPLKRALDHLLSDEVRKVLK